MRNRTLLILLLLLLVSCEAPSPAATFDGEKAYEHVEYQCDLGFRPPGSEANRATADYIVERLEEQRWATQIQDFTYRDTPVRNVIGKKGKGPVVIVGAHYDTRRSADQENPEVPVMGANDGASGVAVLLELARTLDRGELQNEVWLTFFDAEDNGELNGWEWCVGSKYIAEHLDAIDSLSEEQGSQDATPEAVVIADMIGDADQQLYLERNSDPKLQKHLWDIAATLGYTETFISKYRWRIYDDHVPFAQRGITAVDIIDFDYPYWHTTQDTRDKVSPDSLEKVGRVLEVWLEQKDEDKK